MPRLMVDIRREIAAIAASGIAVLLVEQNLRTALRLADRVVVMERGRTAFAGASEVNANPRDTADWPDGVWTLPPSLRLKDKDRERYLAIGESDRMTLKFVKPR